MRNTTNLCKFTYIGKTLLYIMFIIGSRAIRSMIFAIISYAVTPLDKFFYGGGRVSSTISNDSHIDYITLKEAVCLVK